MRNLDEGAYCRMEGGETSTSSVDHRPSAGISTHHCLECRLGLNSTPKTFAGQFRCGAGVMCAG